MLQILQVFRPFRRGDYSALLGELYALQNEAKS